MNYKLDIKNLEPSHWKAIGFLTLAEWASIGVYTVINSIDYDIYLKLAPSVVLGGLSAYAYGIELSKNKKFSELEIITQEKEK